LEHQEIRIKYSPGNWRLLTDATTLKTIYWTFLSFLANMVKRAFSSGKEYCHQGKALVELGYRYR
jgi:hypothetical protein